MKSSFALGKLGDILREVHDEFIVDPTKEYQGAGILSYGRGLFHKGPFLGSETSYRTLKRLRKGQLVYSRLFAWEGAFAVVEPEFDGACVSQEFPVFEVAPSADVHWIHLCLTRKSFWESLVGTGLGQRRRRIQPEEILSRSIPFPPIEEQRRISHFLKDVENRLIEIHRAREIEQSQMRGALLGEFRRVIQDANWVPMDVAAPLVRRPVEVDPLGTYLEVGVRSFGKGTFHKPPTDGATLGTKRIFSVEPNDLIFNIVFAWEGAVAVARPEDKGRVGSHRFLSCVPRSDIATSEFLWFHFLTPKGLEDLGKASPGGAGRNRTLGLDALAKIDVPLPPIGRQQWFNSLLGKIKELGSLHEDMKVNLQALWASTMNRAVLGKHVDENDSLNERRSKTPKPALL